MQNIRLYTTRICGFCTAAKRLLSQYEVPYEEIDVSGDPVTRQWLVDTTGQRTVPQVFIGQTSIGGFGELRVLAARGELLAMVEGSTIGE